MNSSSSAPPPLVSVIISFHNKAGTLSRCLTGVARQTCKKYEVILVDDRSTDNSAAIARRQGYAPITGTSPWPLTGNEAAARSRGDILFFTDADVVLPPDMLERVVGVLQEKGWDAVVGSYDAANPNLNLVSQYKNLWIHYSYMKLRTPVSFLFGAVCAVRRRAFFDTEGFRPGYDIQTGGEDLDLGLQLKQKGYLIGSDPSLAVTHLRRYSLWGLLKNDWYRSCGYVQYAIKQQIFATSVGRGGIANIHSDFTVSMAIVWLALLFFAAALARIPGAVPFLIGLTGAYLALNYSFIRFFCKNRSLRQALQMIPVMVCDHLVCSAGCLAGMVARYLKSGQK